MIWDCFTFNNELDLLDLRLHTLAPVVDKFVLVEATTTHSGKPKHLFFEQNMHLFKKFLDKIVHVVVLDMPKSTDYWIPENFQRNAIIRGLKSASPQDTILISDLDEIPRPSKLGEIQSTGITIFQLDYYLYFLNSRSPDEPVWNLGTRAVRFLEMKSPQETRLYGNRRQLLLDKRVVFHGGWHFSHCGGIERLIEHQCNTPDQQLMGVKISQDIAENKRRMDEGRDPQGWRKFYWSPVPIDETFPEYLRCNPEKFAKLMRKI